MSLKQFNLKQELVEYLESKRFQDFTEVQRITIPAIIKNQQMLVESPTGTGKTLAFLLPLIQLIDENKGTQGVIFVPTRELGTQIHGIAKEIQKFYDFSLQLAIGGVDLNRQQTKFDKKPNIIVTTPERFNKLRAKTSNPLDNINRIILDEADMHVSFGSIHDIQDFMNTRQDLRVSMFSATLPLPLQNFIKKTVKGHVKNIVIASKVKETHFLVKADNDDRFKALKKIMTSSTFNPFFAIIFCKSNEEVIELYRKLREDGLKDVSKFTSEMSQRERNRVLKSINNMDIVYLVTTDLISRGMDFPAVSHVINYNFPSDMNYYKHRTGRTNRNDIEGKVFLIASSADGKKLEQVRRKYDLVKPKL
ncbi:MAG: hypothetical protein DRP42_00905 [Tenericutes bacterium]|nr:MAG: hypothetical protein DRP42_00905 [Mycoplasmatota bacterium]